MRRSGLSALIGFVVIVFGLLVAVLAAGWRPLLGLDLQGGVAVVLKPTTAADDEQIEQAVSVIRSRVDAIGVAEPDISVQGGNVVVQLPGVKDRERALELVGSTAELRFRPVLQAFPPPGPTATTTTAAPAAPATTTAAGSAATTTLGVTSTAAATTVSNGATGSTEQGLAPAAGGAGPGEHALAPLRRQVTTTVAPPASSAPVTSTTAATTDATTAATPDTTVPAAPSGLPSSLDITPRAQDTKEATVILPLLDDEGNEIERYLLGPTMVTGDALVAAETRANLNPSSGEWFVQISFKDGDQNVGGWRRAAAACFQGTNQAVCPSGRLAAVLDGVVISAPSVNDTFSTTNEAVITGNFTQGEAQDLAQKLRYGALPVEFERQQSQDVSATIGRDALRAGLAAGIIGLVVVSLYILAYYRLLGAVALSSLVLSFCLLWTIISWLGETRGLALSLSGVVGIIVAIGVSVDSNIVYFEHIKDDMATGRNMRSSAVRSFDGAISTIIKADLVSLIGAGLLYFLTVGPVKGFALFLGLSTLLDLVASYFFMRPAVVWLSRTNLAARSPRAFGIPGRPAIPAAVKVGA